MESSSNVVNEVSSLPALREPIGRADKVYDKKTRKWRLHKKATPKDHSQRFERFVIITARVFTLQGAFSGQYEVTIRGHLLCEELNRVFSPDSNINFAQNSELSGTDLMTLYHALPVIENRLNSLENIDANFERRFELNAGVLFIKEHWSHVIAEMNLVPDGQIKFDHLWTLFSPGCLVYSIDELDQDCVYRYRSCTYKRERDESRMFEIEAGYLDSNGQRIGYIEKIFLIKEFRESMTVTDLVIYPFELHYNYEEQQKSLLERADKALRLQGRHLQDYKGHAIMQNSRSNVKFNSHGRVMLDPILFDQVQPNNTLVPSIWRPVRLETLRDEDKITMSGMLYGFSLGDKIWGAFAITRLSDVIWDPSILESVAINDTMKQFLKSIVKIQSSFSNTKKFDDLVRDKGKGLVGLFTGPPGVGKTLTAEAIAEVAERPLITLSSGEMGDNSVSVEERLNKELELAEAWNAILLLDEADVFMAERGSESMVQNAITSVFLRKLEYYQGILLLTTNRIDTIDSAFESRIHFCFHYEDLDTTARFRIWNTFLEKVAASKEVSVDISDEEKRRLAARELNGRQIKNIVSVSRLYALQEKIPLSLKVVRMAVSFTQFTPETPTIGLKRKRSKVET